MSTIPVHSTAKAPQLRSQSRRACTRFGQAEKRKLGVPRHCLWEMTLVSRKRSILKSPESLYARGSLKKKILTVSQFGGWILTLCGGFFSKIAPPDDSLSFWPSYASLLAGLVFVVYRNLGLAARKRIVWFAVGLAAVLPVYYLSKYQALTAQCGPYRIM